MATYLRFYQLENPPFTGESKRSLVLGTRSLHDAMNEIKQGIQDGSPRICLSGSEGIGKTSLCRALPKLLAEEATVVAILNPNRPWEEIRTIIGKKLQIPGGVLSRKTLLAVREATQRRIVVVFDQAELLPHEVLDHLDILLQYKDERGEQLVHCVMLSNLEAAATGTEVPLLWWLDKLTTLQLQFAPIQPDGISHYVAKHLAKAGWTGGELFDAQACQAIYRNTGGIPRAINEICEHALVEAGVRALESIDSQFIEALCADTLADPSAYANRRDPEIPGGIPLQGGDSFSLSAQELLDHMPVEERTPERPPARRPADLPRQRKPEPASPREDTRFAPSQEAVAAAIASTDTDPRAAAGRNSSDTPSLELAHEPRRPPEEPMVVPSIMSQRPPRAITGSRPIRLPHRRRRRIPVFSSLLLIVLGIVAVMEHTGRLDLLAMLPSQVDEVAARVDEVTPKFAKLAPKLRELPLIPSSLSNDSNEPEERHYRKRSILDDADEVASLDLDSELEPEAIDEVEATDDPIITPSVDDESSPLHDTDAVTALQDRSPGDPNAAAAPSERSLRNGAGDREASTGPSTLATHDETTGRLAKPGKVEATPVSAELNVVNEYTALPELEREPAVSPPARPADSAANPAPSPKQAPEKSDSTLGTPVAPKVP